MKNHKRASVPGGQVKPDARGNYRTHIFVQIETHEAIRKLAFEQRASMSGMIETLLREALAARGLL